MTFSDLTRAEKSLYGRTLTDIKSDPDLVEFFAANVAKLVDQILGSSLSNGTWCIVTSPLSTKSLFFAKNRRHKVKNFAPLISARLGELPGIPFYEDIAESHSSSRSAWLAKNHRVGAVFTFGGEPPKVSNTIVFDDFVTTGATMISMRELLMPLQKNLVYFTAISNIL